MHCRVGNCGDRARYSQLKYDIYHMKTAEAREEQLRGIGETLQASADAAMEQLNRRVMVSGG